MNTKFLASFAIGGALILATALPAHAAFVFANPTVQSLGSRPLPRGVKVPEPKCEEVDFDASKSSAIAEAVRKERARMKRQFEKRIEREKDKNKELRKEIRELKELI